MDACRPLEQYGLIGNTETCALVSRAGAIDWLPAPHLESPSVFARLLDADGGGHFDVRPVAPADSHQAYQPGTNVLETRFQTGMGRLTVTDALPVSGHEDEEPSRAVLRRLAAPDRPVDVAAAFEPRFDYARTTPALTDDDRGVLAASDDQRAFLTTDLEVDVADGRAEATGTVRPGEPRWLVFDYDDAEPWDEKRARRRLRETVDYWHEWVHTCEESRCVFGGPWHDLVVRSGLVLKLLTHSETGAIAAAPTTSLPESIGGVRNWDYRFNWIRDAAFTLQALANLGHTAEAGEYFEWFSDLAHVESPTEIQPLYGLHGDVDLEERVLDHLAGYCESAPVRVGNAAVHQTQLDTFGELVLATYETAHYEDYLDAADWAAIRRIVEFVCEVWTEPDAGIWEVRDGPHHFVFSKVMCWVALDRGLALARERGFDAPVDRWERVRAEIRERVLEAGYDDEVGAFVQAFDRTDVLDATALLLPIVGFLPPQDERVQRTIEAVRSRLGTEDGLVARYDGPDGLPGSEGEFVLCSFWLVDALALSGRVDEARDVFRTVLNHTSPTGLLAEEVEAESGRLVGNYPQAFSHIGLINSALYLGELSGRECEAMTPLGLET